MRVARSSLQIRCCLAVIVALTNPWSRARAQSLNDAGAWALRASLSLQGDDERQNAVRAKLRGAYEAFLPRVTWEHDLILGGRIDYLPDYSSITNSYYGGIDTMARRDPNVYGVQLSFPILDGLKRFNDLQAAKSALREGAYLNIDKRQQVLLDTANALSRRSERPQDRRAPSRARERPHGDFEAGRRAIRRARCDAR